MLPLSIFNAPHRTCFEARPGFKVYPVSLDPLVSEDCIVATHVAAAFLAVVLGAVQFAAPKGNVPHRTLGYL
jgi:hypothetical protein